MKNRALFGTKFAKGFGRTWLVGGFLFLYLPMVTLMIFSFNHSRLASHWGGFSLEWYRKLADDTEIINGLWLSLKIAVTSATGSVILGTMAAFTLVTFPMITQSLVSAWLLTFSLSLDDVVASAFLSGPGATTMPLVIFSRARLGLDPSVNAVATVMIVVVAICVALASIWVARAERRRAAEISAAARDDS